MVFGVIFAFMPFLSLPSSWSMILLIALGVLTVAIGYTLPGSDIDNNLTMTKSAGTYTDHKTEDVPAEGSMSEPEPIKQPEIIINSDNSTNQ